VRICVVPVAPVCVSPGHFFSPFKFVFRHERRPRPASPESPPPPACPPLSPLAMVQIVQTPLEWFKSCRPHWNGSNRAALATPQSFPGPCSAALRGRQYQCQPAKKLTARRRWPWARARTLQAHRFIRIMVKRQCLYHYAIPTGGSPFHTVATVGKLCKRGRAFVPIPSICSGECAAKGTNKCSQAIRAFSELFRAKFRA